jgi:hypothetical protein
VKVFIKWGRRSMMIVATMVAAPVRFACVSGARIYWIIDRGAVSRSARLVRTVNNMLLSMRANVKSVILNK